MDDSTIVRLCAEAMGRRVDESLVRSVNYAYALSHSGYDPLRDDAQAMALVKRFRLDILDLRGAWSVRYSNDDNAEDWCMGNDADLNRCICECVASLQQAKQK